MIENVGDYERWDFLFWSIYLMVCWLHSAVPAEDTEFCGLMHQYQAEGSSLSN